MNLIAHRGASGYAPENTMAAFEKAVALNVDMIELDVQLTKDQEVVVIHDYTLDRTTNGSGLVSELSLKEVQNLDAGSWFGKEFVGEGVPTLRQVLDWVPEHVTIDIELKSLAFLSESSLVGPVVDIVKSLGKMDSVFFSSFNHRYIQELNRMGIVRCGLLIGALMLEPWNYLADHGLQCESVHPRMDNVDLQMIKGCHDAGLKVLPYTVNDLRVLGLFEAMGVDGVFCNYPDLKIGDKR